MLGSPYYIAPEIIKKHKYNEKVDIWSIGVIIYFLFQERQPFTGLNQQELFDNILNQELKMMKEDWEGISEEALDFIKMCLEKNPEKRPNCT